jgi:phage FluMu gp28-like protein
MKIEVNLPNLYSKQLQAIYSPARYAIIEASTKAGKTLGCIVWITEMAMKSKPHRNYWWVAPVSTQANIAFDRIRKAFGPNEWLAVNKSDKYIRLPNDAIIWFKSADKPDSLYGDDVYGAVIDEASRCKEDSWHAVRSTLTATQGSLRIIGNVKGRKNWAYRLARRAEAGERGMSYHKLTAYDAAAAGVFPYSEIEDAKRTLPDHIFKELYLAEPSDDGGNPFGLGAIADCVGCLSSNPPVAWGWDLAKSQDWTVGIALDVDGHVCRFERFQRPWANTRDAIIQATGKIPALVDSTGVGDPIVEDLQRTAGHYTGFKFTSQSKQQLMEGLALAIHKKEVKFPEGPIKDELEEFEFVHSQTGVKYSAPAGLHDDCVMALALAVAHRRHAIGLMNVPTHMYVNSL